jgi:hypothetical protein
VKRSFPFPLAYLYEAQQLTRLVGEGGPVVRMATIIAALPHQEEQFRPLQRHLQTKT